MTLRKPILILSGPVIFFITRFVLLHFGCSVTAAHVGGVAAWMCLWWFTETFNFGITALVPLIMFPLGNVCTPAETAYRYTDPVIFLFFGGFMLAFAIEKCGLHHRISLSILSLSGSGKGSILGGLMLCTFLISNWISNTATTIMLFSMVMALLHELDSFVHKNKRAFYAAVLMGLAFSASIGGMATPIGTPPNMFFYNLFHRHYPDYHTLTFANWMSFGFPIAILILVFTFFLLYFLLASHSEIKLPDAGFFKEKKKKLGRWKREEILVFGVFIFCVAGWVFRSDIQTEWFVLKGWQHWHPWLNNADDSTVAVLASLLLFSLPGAEKGTRLLEWDDAKKIRYDIILMFGSGFALAYGFEKSGLNQWIAERILLLKGIHPLWLISMVCLVITIISEFASNIASVQLCIPLLMSIHKELNIDPLLLMVPATLAASVGFILPVATAANTIVFSSGYIRMKDMIRVGWILDVFCVLVISFICYLRFS